MGAINTAAACVLFVLCLPARAVDDANSANTANTAEAARAALAPLYARINTAMSEKNTAELGTLLAPSYQGEDVAGKATTAAVLLREVAGLKEVPNRKLETTFGAVTVDGATARTVRRLRITSTLVAGDATPSMEYVAVSDDVWTRAEQGWKLSGSIVRQADFSMQGKLLMHKTHPVR